MAEGILSLLADLTSGRARGNVVAVDQTLLPWTVVDPNDIE